MFGQFASFVDLLHYRAESQANKTIFTFLADGESESDVLSYADLDLRAQAIAALLQTYQAKGERALLLYPPGLDFICAFLGCLYAGVIAVPAYPPRPNKSFDRLHSIIQDAQAKFALTTAELKDKIATRLEELEGSDFHCFATDRLEIISLASHWQKPKIQTEDLAFLQYTSGSTGNPKGVMVSHGNLLHNAHVIQTGFRNTQAVRAVSWLPPYHDMGLIGGILQPIYVGIFQVLMPPVSFLQRPYRWLKAIAHYQATTSGAPNFAYDLCVSQITPEQKATLDLSAWQLAFSGAEPIRSATLDSFTQAFAEVGFQKTAFYPCYGMAETTLMVTGCQPDQLPTEITVSKTAIETNQVRPAVDQETEITLIGSGQVIGDQQVRIVDPQTLQLCPDGEIGEIWVKGGSVAQGYWQKQTLTEAIFQAQVGEETGFLRTGDLGFFQQDELYITGRLKDLLIIRGRNHYPQDLELTMETAHVAIRQGAGAAVSIEVDGAEELVLIQEIERQFVRHLDVEEVAQAVRGAIATEHQVQPYAICFIKTGSIPKTSSGKIRRHACKIGFLEGSLDVIGEWVQTSDIRHQISDIRLGEAGVDLGNSPATVLAAQPIDQGFEQKEAGTLRQSEIEQWLMANIAQRLGLNAQYLQVNEPFASYGLDSVQAVQVTADLEDWLERRLEPTLAYDYPTIRALANFLVQGDTAVEALAIAPKVQATEIAIVGLGCRFPQADNPEAFWEMLQQGKDGIRQLGDRPDSDFDARWNTGEWGGFLDRIDQFDPQFFGISPREAEQMDPQQRLLLEVSWEALERAGIPAESLPNSATGVFVGISNSDYAQLQVRENNPINAYMGTGNAHSIAANRLSYFLDLRGPSLSVDTACSSSLVAVHLACQSLLSGECEQAIAAGINLILTPDVTQTFTQAGMMSEAGRCKTFDDSADGYVRGEGCGVVILKPLEAAVRDGDNVLAVIYGSAVNQDGRSNGLTAPNGRSQQAVIRQALAQANITAADLDYLEAHGTGTPLGDPIEINSVKAVLKTEGDRQNPCVIGSVKTNIGHLEAAAGIAGLIKVILSLQHSEIPQHLHFQQLNARIDLEDLLAIAQTSKAWQSQDKPRFAGVSSFGFGGTNAHIILGDRRQGTGNSEQVLGIREQVSGNSDRATLKRPWHILTFSAKSQQALNALQQSYLGYVQSNSNINLQDLCFSANMGRSPFSERRFFVFQTHAELQAQLSQNSHQPHKITPQKIAFLFTGQGSQYYGMGRQLYQSNALFKDVLDHCDRLWLVFSPTAPTLVDLLYGDQNPDLVHETIYTQPLLFAVEYAIAQLWISWGITPDFCMGHSVGEYVAACLAGVFSLEDGMKLITARGNLMHELPSNGSMVAVFADKTVIKPYLSENLTVGAENGSHLVLSGQTPFLQESITKLQSQGIKTKSLKVSHAFHSPLMEPMLEGFRHVAEQITYHLPRIPLISNVTGSEINGAIATADYWVTHVLQPVKFVQSIQHLAQSGVNIYLEIGAKPVLLSMGRHCLPDHEALWLPSLRPQTEDWQEMLSSLGKLYEQGVSINWQNFVAGDRGNKLILPTYPFQRQRYWFNEQSWTKKLTQQEDFSQWFYQIVWQPSELPTQTINAEKTWLIFGDRRIDQNISDAIYAQFSNAKLVYLGKENSFAAAQTWEVNPDQFDQLFAQLKTVNLGGIIHCWSLDAEATEIEQAQWLSCGTTLKLIQALHDQKLAIPCWFVTQQSQKVLAADQLQGFSSSSLWGLGQAIALEHPELWGGIIDLDETLPNFPQLCAQTELQHCAMRQNVLYTATLKPQAIAPQNPIEITPQSTYLITGGLGTIGRRIATWLSKKNVKKIILLSRRRANPEILKDLPIGADIYQCDLADSDQVKKLFEQYKNIKGIFHAAGTLADGLLQGQTWSNFQKVMSAKVRGTWNLHLHSQQVDLDFFVLFSSVAAVLGSPGQGNYGAANRFMDAIAQYRQAQNLPALSLNWGPWAEGGMAEALVNQGLERIKPEQGINLLEQLLGQRGQIGIFKPDWQSLVRQFPEFAKSHYFSEVITPSKQAKTSTIFEQLMRLDASARAAFLLDYLRRSVATILKLEVSQIQAHDSLLDLGMDSLMIMEAIAKLKQDLQLMLYPREIYERPRLDILTAYLATEFTKIHDQNFVEVVANSPQQSLTVKTSQAWQKPAQKNQQPIAFILSSPRSGSTLLRVMLAGHPALYSPPELHLLPFETMGDRATELGISHLGEGLQRALMDLEELSPEASQKKVSDWVAENRSIADIYTYLQAQASPRLLIDKSPSYGSDRHILEHGEILFENAKYIHLIRHPYAVIESFNRLRMDKLLGAQKQNPYALAESIWAESNQNILGLANAVNPDQYLQVIYEDLVRNPQPVLTQICDFLGIDFDESVLNPYSGDRLTDGLHEQSLGVGDPNFLQHKTIDPELADKWRSIQLPHRLQAATIDLATTFKYDLPHDRRTDDANENLADTTPSFSPLVEQMVSVRGVEYCLCEWGDRQQPLILLLHGILEQGASWQLIAPQLAEQGYWVVAPDLRGHGKSAHAQSYSMLDFLADVDDLAKQLTDKPFTLVGHSMGSVIGAMYAGIRQTQIQRLILIETIVPNDIDDAETGNHISTHLDYLANPPQHPTFPDVAIAARRLRQVTPQLSQALSETLAERSTIAVKTGVQWRWDAFLRTRAGIEFNGISRRRYLALLRDIQAPIALIYGAQSEFNRPEDFAAIQTALPQAERFTVAGGHNLHFENPQAIAQILKQQLSDEKP